jgi:hypothetical protein
MTPSTVWVLVRDYSLTPVAVFLKSSAVAAVDCC